MESQIISGRVKYLDYVIFGMQLFFSCCKCHDSKCVDGHSCDTQFIQLKYILHGKLWKEITKFNTTLLISVKGLEI